MAPSDLQAFSFSIDADEYVVLTFHPAECIGISRADDPDVTLVDQGGFYVLSNGIITTRIDQRSGDVQSFKYKDLELLQSGAGRTNAYWSLPGTSLNFGAQPVTSIGSIRSSSPSTVTVPSQVPHWVRRV